MFPKLFQRGVNDAAFPALGSDVAPTDVSYLKLTNVFNTRARSGDNLMQRVAVGAIYAGVGTPDPFDFAFYLWDANTKTWFALPSVAVSVPAGEVGFAELPVLVDPKSNEASLDLAVLMTVGGSPPDGVYTAVLAADFGGGSSSGALPAGSATAANQATEIARLTSILARQSDRTQKTQITNGTQDNAAGFPLFTALQLGTTPIAASAPLPVALQVGTVPVDATHPVYVAGIAGATALALDTTLTGGSQVAQLKSGTKGTSTAALVTSTANGTNNQGLDVVEQFASPAEDNAGTYTGAARLITSERGSYHAITDAAAHNAIKSGFGVLRRITVNKATALGTLTVYDALTATGTPIAIITMPAALLQTHMVFEYGVKFTTGLTIVGGTAAMDSTVVFE